MEAADEQLCEIKKLRRAEKIASLMENLAIGGPNVHGLFVLLRNLQRVSIA